jgi:transient receptor potential cation channel subfamily M protein 2
MMMMAIQLNRVDFVDLFLDNGVSLKDFLTVRRLLKLYNNVSFCVCVCVFLSFVF